MTRPNTSFAINKLSQFLHASTAQHWQACKRVLRYLRCIVEYGLKFQPIKALVLEGFTDADWANNIDDKTTSSYCISLGRNLIQWIEFSKAKGSSNVEVLSEYRALAQAATKIVWLQSLFAELGLKIAQAAILWCENIRT